jgi:CDP-diacylglycerol--serine O-phosphatidyltransferase
MFLFRAENNFNLANMFTFVNISAGVIAVYFITEGLYNLAVLSAWIGGAFDIFDGKIARKYKLSTEFGVQLDSFADFLSFVVVPVMLIYFAVFKSSEAELWVVAPVTIFYVIAGLRRLINFNLKSDAGSVEKFFEGVPTPLGAILIWLSFLTWQFNLITEPLIIALWIAVVGYLLNSRVKIPHP